jgi:3-oxoadipate enol-lactonase
MPTAYINGIGVYFEVVGSGQPLLFIHGLGSTGRDWEPQVDALKARYQCITYDVRGHGRTGKPPGPYSVAQFAADAAGLLRHLEINTAHFIGLSLGAMITFQTAVDRPDVVNSMVIVNALPYVSNRTLKDKLAIWQRLILFRVLSMERIGQIIAKRLFPAENQADLRAQFVARWRENDKQAYMAATRSLVGWTVEDRISTIQAPTLIIAADQDYTPVEAKEAIVEKMANAELAVLTNARHAVNYVQPGRVNPLIQEFLAQMS